MAGDNVRGHAVIIASIAIGLIDAFAIILRFIARKKTTAKLAADDWILLASLLPAYTMIIIASIRLFILFFLFQNISIASLPTHSKINSESSSPTHNHQNDIPLLLFLFEISLRLVPNTHTRLYDKSITNYLFSHRDSYQKRWSRKAPEWAEPVWAHSDVKGNLISLFAWTLAFFVSMLRINHGWRFSRDHLPPASNASIDNTRADSNLC